MIKYAFLKECGWIRIGKLIFQYKSTKPLFSERNGYVKYFNIGFGYRVRFCWENK